MKDLFGDSLESLTEERKQLQIKIAELDKRIIKLAGDPALEILEFLNHLTGKKYKPVPATMTMIRARLKEFSLQELKTMVVRKNREWRSDDKLSKYIRPATLFNATRCNNYVGECVT